MKEEINLWIDDEKESWIVSLECLETGGSDILNVSEDYNEMRKFAFLEGKQRGLPVYEVNGAGGKTLLTTM